MWKQFGGIICTIQGFNSYIIGIKLFSEVQGSQPGLSPIAVYQISKTHIGYANIIYVVCQDMVQENETEQEMQEDKLWAKMIGDTGVHDQK